jgi:hypothetical protein
MVYTSGLDLFPEVFPLMRLSRTHRRKLYYLVEEAGAQVTWSRAESYRRAHAGDMPTEKDGKFILVPKGKWDPIVRRLRRRLREASARGRPRKPHAKAEDADVSH